MSMNRRIFSTISENDRLTEYALAKTLGVATSQTTSWKSRKTDPPAKYIPAIADFLGASIHWLVTGEESQSGGNWKKLHAKT